MASTRPCVRWITTATVSRPVRAYEIRGSMNMSTSAGTVVATSNFCNAAYPSVSSARIQIPPAAAQDPYPDTVNQNGKWSPLVT
ncbi:hypothetical protein PC9H_000004 [Pleurotus ostreatus]|uniref:Uncharacterized protein n=1 Tax=Pleurotus ostreatus TaxID=5322 RepID=A0A8H7A119_PLEOS|nr:uncharacterized protein PC9H_000004 [Pleurotus ostreatus]KAF7439668.1 hypothetical protein PC9H_000004 [Pleurotus ostreatus]